MTALRFDVVRLLTSLLHLYPPGHRERFGDEMREVLITHYRRRRARGAFATSIYLLRASAELVANAFLVWVELLVRGGVGSFRLELRPIVRKFLRTPGFTAITVLTLALGIGANAAIFSVVNGVLLKPLPFHDPHRLVGVWHKGFSYDGGLNQSPALYFTYRDDGQVFEDIGLWDNSSVSVTGLEEPERLDAMFVTDGTFPILGVEPALGRTFTAEDDSPGSPETVILGHGYWESRFAASPGVLGKTLTINGELTTIIGVMPKDFRFPRIDPAVWLPFQFDRSEVSIGNFSYQGVARLRPGVSSRPPMPTSSA